MPSTTAVCSIVMCCFTERVDSHEPDGSLYFFAVDAAAGGSPCVQHLVGSVCVSVPSGLQSASSLGPHWFGLYGHTASSTPPNCASASTLSWLSEPAPSANAPSCFFTDHCRYCSEKSGFARPALMYRCSISAVVEKIVQTPRCA